ncbi:MAG: hypothetical protein ABEI07_02840 [Candidatus Nanohaloarchaea archaeon]
MVREVVEEILDELDDNAFFDLERFDEMVSERGIEIERVTHLNLLDRGTVFRRYRLDPGEVRGHDKGVRHR